MQLALGEARSGLRVDRQAVAAPHHDLISMRCRSRVEAPSLLLFTPRCSGCAGDVARRDP
jgi:hypothetical protein